MKKVNIHFFLFIFIVLLCPLCNGIYEHDEDHCIVDIYNKAFFEEKDITYENIISEFEEVFNKTKDLKQKIEDEIEKINKSHSKIMEEITESFENQHIKLNEKEKMIKAELDLKVTKMKEELEKFLLESNEILISC